MAGRRVIYDQVPGFAGGLNAVASPVALGETQLQEATNVRLTEFGAVTKRGGTQRITSAVLHANGIKGLYEWDLSDGARYVLAVANGTLYWASYGSFPMTFTAVTGALSNTADIAWAAFRDASGDALYIADGGQLNKLTVAAGPAFTLSADIASTPSITDVEVFNQRLWACGSAAFPQAIFYSDLNDGDTLGVGASSGGQINVRTFGQQNVTAVRSLGTSLLIYHRGGISRLTGFGQDDTIAVPAGVTGDVGTTASDGVARVNNLLYYANVRGLFVASAEGITQIGTPDKPDPLSIALPTLSETQLASMSLAFYKNTNELLVHVPSVGVYVFNTILQAWSGPWTGTFFSAGRQYFAEVGNTTDTPVMLKGDSSGWIEELDPVGAYTDSVTATGVAGTQFAMTATARRMFSGDFADAKAYRFGYIIGDLDGSDSASVSWQTDLGGGEYVLSQTAGEFLTTEAGDELQTEANIYLVSATGTSSLRIPMWSSGYYVDVTLTDSSVNATPSFARIEVEAFSLGRR